jgi:hypothetical protein
MTQCGINGKKATPYTIPQIKYRPSDLEKTGQLHKSISAKG